MLTTEPPASASGGESIEKEVPRPMSHSKKTRALRRVLPCLLAGCGAPETPAESGSSADHLLGLTQEQLAGILNVARQTVSKWETGVSHS